MKNNKKQQGFTLVTVMILSSIAGVVVLSSLKDNTNQERLSGNFQKGLNARLVAEQGVYNTLAAGTAFLANNPGIALPQFVNGVGVLNGNNALAGTTYTAQFAQNGAGQLTITSTGNRFESQAFITANVNLITGVGNSTFDNAIVGCEGVNLSGSGAINSYDSADGNYADNISGNEGNVRTIDHNGADVVLGGSSPIFGDINSTGEISTNSSTITGNLHANGNVVIRDSGRELVSGDIRVGGNLALGASSISGNILVNGNININNHSASINNNNGNLGTVQYGGSDSNFIGPSGFYANETYNINPNIASVANDDPDAEGFDERNPDTNCDHLAIISNISDVNGSADGLVGFSGDRSGKSFDITPSGITGSGGVNSDNFPFLDVVPESAFFLGETNPTIKLDSFNLDGSDRVTISGGNVTLFVENDFVLAGGTQLTIAEGSSLTLIVKGEVVLGNGSDIIAERQGIVESTGLPAVSIYSSYESQGNEPGVTISGDFNVYAAIYAPLANADIVGSGVLNGSLRAKDVSVTGNARIHFDTALRNSTLGGGGGGAVMLALANFQY